LCCAVQNLGSIKRFNDFIAAGITIFDPLLVKIAGRIVQSGGLPGYNKAAVVSVLNTYLQTPNVLFFKV